MATNPEKRALFPLLFGDLMMGAAAIIIVTLVFLKIVPEKGQAEFIADDVVALPPGLLDTQALPLVRIRVLECGSNTTKQSVKLFTGQLIEPIGSGRSDECHLSIYRFERGLNQRSVVVKGVAKTRLKSVQLTVFVGGYQTKPIELENVQVQPDIILGSVSFSNPTSIWRKG